MAVEYLDLTASDHLYRTFPPQEAPKLVRFGRKFLSRIPVNAGLQVYAEYASGSWSVTTFPGTKSPVGGVDWAVTDGAVINEVIVFNGGSLLPIGDTAESRIAELKTALTTAGYTVSV